ncbi:adenosylhomocysteinase [Rathayibacter caricis DSM 15933]|uniref:Adenosylhomocysteinase n=1 Tax=Rathayibacter caricis DSM 15933 TaxID=1328867 RepID=A0A2T4UQU9_9MICO|nr:adenosylhomocysteinase [Rathayibacter caricis]PTL71909.1 adenosylhomocysteinase [Rathayibacter caricis DSM 15933]
MPITQLLADPASRWALEHMPLTAQAVREVAPVLRGKKLAMCLHVEPKTAALVSLLVNAGMDIALTGSPGTTKDEVADDLRRIGVTVHTRQSDDEAQHARNLEKVLEHDPDLTLDNGGDLTLRLINAGTPEQYLGGTEETTTGGIRLREHDRSLGRPVIVINDSPLKLIVENEYGVGQSVIQGFMNATNLMIPGTRAAVIGYGPCGRGVADTLAQLGARVSIADVDPIRSLQAILRGHRVGSIEDVLSDAQFVFTATGAPGVIGAAEIEAFADGAVIAGVGHFPWEIDEEALTAATESVTEFAAEGRRQGIRLKNGKQIIRLERGRMINLTAASGNPIQAMDLGLTLQVRSHAAVITDPLDAVVQPVPPKVEHRIATDLVALLTSR